MPVFNFLINKTLNMAITLLLLFVTWQPLLHNFLTSQVERNSVLLAIRPKKKLLYCIIFFSKSNVHLLSCNFPTKWKNVQARIWTKNLFVSCHLTINAQNIWTILDKFGRFFSLIEHFWLWNVVWYLSLLNRINRR